MKMLDNKVKNKVIANKRLNNSDLERMVNPEKVSSANEIIGRIKLPDTSRKELK
jgi:hypothetical protein